MIRTLATALSAAVVLASGMALAQNGATDPGGVSSSVQAPSTTAAKDKQSGRAFARRQVSTATRRCLDGAAINGARTEAAAKGDGAMRSADAALATGVSSGASQLRGASVQSPPAPAPALAQGAPSQTTTTPTPGRCASP